MKKRNVDNEDNREDQQLIKLIKTADLEKPSASFVDNTLSQFFAVKRQAVNTHKQLRLPLILMLVLTVLLILPLVLSNIAEASFSGSIQGFYESMNAVSHELQKWYLIYPMALLLVLILLTHIEMKFPTYQNVNR